MRSLVGCPQTCMDNSMGAQQVPNVARGSASTSMLGAHVAVLEQEQKLC